MGDAPIELIALDEPAAGMISARRQGEPSFSAVTGIGDALMAAMARGVDLVIPAQLAEQLRSHGDLPPELPAWIKIR